MAKEIINVGQAANDGTGDPLRNAFEKVNSNFTELYDTADTQDLDFTGDSGTGAVELDSQTLNLVGTNGVQTTANGQTITIDTSSLDTRLTTAEADIDTNTASITTEETARIAADTTLQTNIDSEASTRASADTSEAATRLANDNTLQGNIDTEASTRATADTTLQTNIDTEATTRGSADTTLQTNIDSEAATRLANDNTLQSNIDAEAATRLANDNTLQGNIDTEASTRSSADTALQGQIDSNDTDIATNAANIATNTTNISSNDTDISGLDSRLTTAEGNISSNDTDIANNVTNIATNATDIATNVTNIASNDTDISNLQSSKQNISEKNQANGYAPLDSGAKIPIANLPDSVVGQVEYQGTWDASINDPTLPSASTVKGHYYVVSVGGTYETITYAIGDWIISNGVAWEKIDNTDAVTTVFGRLGAIVANEGDYSSYYPLIADLTAAEADIATNATNISSNDTDITALQNDKYDKTGGTITGNATITGNLIVDTNTLYVNSTNNRVGIGTASPNAELEIHGNLNIGDGTSVTSIGLQRNSANYITATDAAGYLAFRTGGTNERMRIHSGGDISFRDTSANEAFYWDASTARLGIGAGSSPTGTLTAFNTGSDSAGSNPVLAIGSGNYHWRRTTDGSKLILDTYYGGWNPTFTVDRISGNVGIGANDPEAIFQVGDTTASVGTVSKVAIGIGDVDTGFYRPAFNTLGFVTTGVERMRIDSSGNVGIKGTGTKLGWERTSDNSANIVYLTKNEDLGVNGNAKLHGYDGIIFSTEGSETTKMTIDSSGRVGINRVPPAGALSLEVMAPTGYSLGAGFHSLVAQSTIEFKDINTTANYKVRIGSETDDLVMFAGGSLRMRITSAGAIHLSQGTGNAFVGTNAGNLGTNTGTNISAFGVDALSSNTTGSENSAFGKDSLYSSTTGDFNTAIGNSALYANTTGTRNTASGYNSLFNNTVGNYNTATGYTALYSNTTGVGNTAYGYVALQNNTTGGNSVAIGYAALLNSTGGQNTSIGTYALSATTTGVNNTGVGYNAQASSAIASNEVILGNNAVTTLRCNTQTISSLSDIRDKKDIKELQGAEKFIKELKPVSFVWNQRDGGRVDIDDNGFIAQDLIEAQEKSGHKIPNLVLENNPEKLEAAYGAMLPTIVSALQSALKEIDLLKTEIETLKNK